MYQELIKLTNVLLPIFVSIIIGIFIGRRITIQVFKNKWLDAGDKIIDRLENFDSKLKTDIELENKYNELVKRFNDLEDWLDRPKSNKRS